MRLLLDTHVLIWALRGRSPLSPTRWARIAGLITDAGNEPVFSAASVWEVALKFGRAREDFGVEPEAFLADLLASGYAELAITGAHAASVARLPQLHADPFDRLLVAQALAEALTLITVDAQIGRYPGMIRKM